MAKSQIGPRIDHDVADTYRDFVTFVNDGTYKGRLGDEVERAVKYHIALYFIQHPNELQRATDSEDIGSDDFVEQVRSIVNEVTGEILVAAQQFQVDQGREQDGLSDEEDETTFEKTPSDRLFNGMEEPDAVEQIIRRLDRLEQKID